MANRQYDINYTNLRQFKVKLLYVTSAKYETDWHSSMHKHNFTELFYCIKGKGRFHIENEVFDVGEDDLVIVNSNIKHTESSKDQSPLEYIVLGIEGISLTLSKDEQSELYSIHNYQNYKHEILFYIKALLLEASQTNAYYDLISQNLLEILIYNIIRRAETKLVLSNYHADDQSLSYLKNYIENNYSQNINLDTLSKLVNINKFYLIHTFKKVYNCTPMQYLVKVRMDRAEKLLRDTDLAVSQIARIIGINSHSYFSQSFKKIYHKSPQEYKESIN